MATEGDSKSTSRTCQWGHRKFSRGQSFLALNTEGGVVAVDNCWAILLTGWCEGDHEAFHLAAPCLEPTDTWNTSPGESPLHATETATWRSVTPFWSCAMRNAGSVGLGRGRTSDNKLLWLTDSSHVSWATLPDHVVSSSCHKRCIKCVNLTLLRRAWAQCISLVTGEQLRVRRGWVWLHHQRGEKWKVCWGWRGELWTSTRKELPKEHTSLTPAPLWDPPADLPPCWMLLTTSQDQHDFQATDGSLPSFSRN